VQRQQFVRGEPIAAMLAQAVSQALRRDPAQRFADYDELATAIKQAGAPASPNRVAELVQQVLTHESVEELQARIARSEARDAPKSVRPNLQALSWPPHQNGPAPITVEMALPEVVLVPALPSLRARPRLVPKLASMFPRPVVPQVSAFPIGDMLRAQRDKPLGLWPVGIAASVLLGFAAWGATSSSSSPAPDRQSTTNAVRADASDLGRAALLPPSAPPLDAGMPVPTNEPPPPSAAAAEVAPVSAPPRSSRGHSTAHHSKKHPSAVAETVAPHVPPAATPHHDRAQTKAGPFIPDDI
jgi:hypothetical protein